MVVAGVAPTDEVGNPPGFVQMAWMGLMRTLDAGTMGGDTGSWPFLFVMFAVTLGDDFIAEAGDKDKNHGVWLNPDKSALITCAPGDQLIVLAKE